MPLIINMISGANYLVEGEAAPVKPWKAGRVMETRNLQAGRPVVINLGAIAACEVWPKEQYEAEKKARVEALVAERHKSPNPGNAPRIVRPR